MKKYIVVALLMVFGTVIPAYSWWAVGATGGGVAVSGGSTEPEVGTALGGQQTTSGGNDMFSDSYELVYDNGGFTVTWAESAATTTASKMQIYSAVHWGGNCKALLYTAAGALVASSDSTATTGWTEGWHDFAFSSAPTVTKGDTYKMGMYCDTGADLQIWYASSGTQYYDTSGTYASPPSTLSGSELTTNLNIAIRLVK